MLGGGIFVTQNKVLPGSYINVINSSAVNSTVGDRGVVAIALPIGKAEGTVIELTRTAFVNNCSTILGVDYNADAVAPLREIFLHANKVYIYDISDGAEVSEIIKALEPYEFNILCAYTGENAKDYCDAVIDWRDNLGKKCQVVVYNQTDIDHEGIINVVSTVSDGDAHALVAWVAGAEAGCKINESCTNMLYDGEYNIVVDKSQSELEQCIKDGQVAFHLVYGSIRMLEDVNSLITVTDAKGEDFQYNQTIRIIDQIANDIAKMFNTKYLGRIPNNASGRTSLWADIVAHHRQLEAVQAIEPFDSSLLTVEAGATKKSVIVNDAITVINSMSQLYMTVVIQ